MSVDDNIRKEEAKIPRRSFLKKAVTTLGSIMLAGYIGTGIGCKSTPTCPVNSYAPIVISVRKLINGFHGSEFWTLKYRLPLKLFEKYYGEKVSSGLEASANFYKCGDQTEFLHYGAWNPIQSPMPDFHRPEFFGRIIFD